MNLTHAEMMLIIQGLRLLNGLDVLGTDYTPTIEERTQAMNLLIRIDPNIFKLTKLKPYWLKDYDA